MKTWIKVLMLVCISVSFLGTISVYAAPEDYQNVAVSQVSDYVNVRTQPNTTSEIVGKIYNNCAATILSTVEGEEGTWYQIQSGTVEGYIKAQYFITGAEAEAKAKEVGTEFATVVNANSLRLRERADLSSNVLTMLSEGACYEVVGEEANFAKIAVDADLTGYVSKDYIKTRVEFEKAVSLKEEAEKIAEQNRLKQEADTAIQKVQELQQIEKDEIIKANPEKDDTTQMGTPPPKPSGSTTGGNTGQSVVVGPGGTSSTAVVSATRTAIVAYAKQYLGYPYVYGGTSLTEGTDCSGFTQAIYKNFGITTGRSSRDQAAKGKSIRVEDAQPGDLLFYASGDYINHVAMYIGGGQIIHASTANTGIIISPSNYRTPYSAVTFLD